MCCRSGMTSGPITRGRHERWTSLEKWWSPTRSDFSKIAEINLILRNARSHLRDECPLTSKRARLWAAARRAARLPLARSEARRRRAASARTRVGPPPFTDLLGERFKRPQRRGADADRDDDRRGHFRLFSTCA